MHLFKENWCDFIKSDKKTRDSKLGESLHFRASKMKLLMKESGNYDVYCGTPIPVGYNHVATKVNVVDNWNVGRREIVELLTPHLYEAIGFFRDKKNETFSPFYWLRWIILLPKELSKIIGGTENKLVTNLLQALYSLSQILLIATKLTDWMKNR